MKNMKAVRLHIAGRIVGFGGVFACLAAAIIWLILVQTESLPYNPITWNGKDYLSIDLAIVAVIAIVFAVVGLILYAAGNHAEYAEEEKTYVATDSDDTGDTATEEETDDALFAVNTDETSDAESDEMTDEEPEEEKKKPAVVNFIETKAKEYIPEERLEKIQSVTKTVQKNAKIILPIAGTVIVAAVLAGSAKKKKQENIRKSFYKWLG